MSVRPLLALTALLALGACTSNEAQQQASQPAAGQSAYGTSGSSTMPQTRLTAAEIQILIPGNTVTGMSESGQPYYAFFRRDGRVAFRQASLTDNGSWRVLPDGRICSTLTRINTNEECYSLYRNGTNVDYHRPDGNRLGTFTVQAGDPQNL